MQFSELIKKYRKKNFLSQTELAKILDVDQKTISLMETREGRIPIMRNIRKLISVLNIPILFSPASPQIVIKASCQIKILQYSGVFYYLKKNFR